MLESIKTSTHTQVCYEAPHRVKEAVEDIVEVLGAQRHIVIAREITKIHEESCVKCWRVLKRSMLAERQG